MLNTLASQSFCAAVNHLLKRETWARRQLRTYAGKVACIQSPPFSLRVRIVDEGWLAAAAPEATQPFDVTITASVDAATAFLQGGQAAALKHVKIEGDAEFAHVIAQLAGQLRWEPEEDLARWVGDAPAHLLVNRARRTVEHISRAAHNLLESTAEYFLEENPQLVRHAALDQMRDELVELRDALARLDKRIERLAAQAQPKP
jgi:ubiquinone biosynthesis protein UbiJ